MALHTPAVATHQARLATGNRSKERTPASIVFLALLWVSLFVAFATLVALIVTTIAQGADRLDARLFTEYPSSRPEEAGARPAILGSLWVIGTTAVLAIPLGVAAAVHLEEFADRRHWFNRFIELNIQNLSAIPSIIYGMLAIGTLALIGVGNKNIVIGGALALALLILPVIIIATREALRAVPRELRHGSLALGSTELQTTWRITLPSAVPGIATGTILALSRALGEAAPLLLLGALVFISFDPNGLLSGFTTMPIQIYGWTNAPQAGFHELAAATSILLVGILLAMNALAIVIRNRYQRRW
ncbi:phosphate ABC transporter permease PstA [Cellulosimicrobium funkei]|uniref:Phosphate transport system permease protein PstA n=1 Tax=Cellulosimicrobium funkei TaxID=264251 RepID=A0A4Y8QYG5_9MICO|nr:phosphate ABC transporter permease PstA [Cellulosimicrobium funkei]TFF04430.1 phosphate ABC transporter permease PstA [Cellulosimicrobium funkei]TGA67905.1 phosphate ABC transporter permease PstA [Cellulosimicrobium terreum]